MSYRDIRNLIKMLRTLGYPNLVSLGSFQTTNFPLVANLLAWLTKRFDPDADIPLHYDTVEERVHLIKSAAEFMALKANVKLNTKKLYQADGYAVKELLKITTPLYDALNLNVRNEEESDEESDVSFRDYDISDKQVADLKQSRTLATEITSSGASLFDLLGKEIDIKPLRQRSINRQFEISEVEEGIKKAIETVKKEIDETNQLIDNVSVTEANLDAKIEKRKAEIDRYEKRLQTLKKVRPAFLEEFTTLEQEMEQLFVQYSTKMRCLNYLERLVGEAERAEMQRQQLAAAQRSAEAIPLDRGEPEPTDMLSFEDTSPEQKPFVLNRPERPRASTGERQKVERPSRSLGRQDEGSRSSLDLSSESDSDDVFLDKDEPELIHSDDDSLALEMEVANLERATTAGRRTAAKMQIHSDDDF